MITKISGRLLDLTSDEATLSVGPLEYEVFVPEFTRRHLQAKLGEDISLHTIDYLEGNPMQGRLTPRMIGFLSSVEREFFELFCSVDGVGVRKALRAMVRPVREIATAIEEQDAKALAGLPGVGPATAERIIAKLRRKVSKFALMVARDEPMQKGAEPSTVDEVFEILVQLGHSEADSRRLLEAALRTKKKFDDVQTLLEAVYQQSHRT
jgi:Holliday junction DNA helicase RuvA